MPEAPVGSEVISGDLVNVPVEDTPDTQYNKHHDAEMLVASIVMLLSLLQPSNMY